MCTAPRAALLIALTATGLTGCGSTEQPGGTLSTPPDTTQPMPSLAQRSAELPVAGADPCALFTGPQLDELKVNSKPRRSGDSCSFDVDLAKPYYSYVLEIITGKDVRAWANHGLTVRKAEVPGFPALSRFRAGADCETLVGVAAGQTLRAQLYPITRNAFDQQELCAMSERAANLAVRTLEATEG